MQILKLHEGYLVLVVSWTEEGVFGFAHRLSTYVSTSMEWDEVCE